MQRVRRRCLQGQVPRADRGSGRAARRDACNLALFGRYPDDAFAGSARRPPST